MKMTLKIRSFMIGVCLLLLVWQLIISLGQYESALFPAPLDALASLFSLATEGSLYIHLKDSLFRFGVGYLLAIVTAVPMGFVLGRKGYLWDVIDPVVQLLRPVSPVAWSPFIVLLFGIGNLPAIIIIFLAAFFPILLTTVRGVRTIEEHYFKLAANLQLNKWELFNKIIFPASLPSVMSGLHLALGTAWIFLVTGEMVGAQSGLGYLIVDARNTLHLDTALAGIIVIGLCGFILDRMITLFEMTLRKYFGSFVSFRV